MKPYKKLTIKQIKYQIINRIFLKEDDIYIEKFKYYQTYNSTTGNGGYIYYIINNNWDSVIQCGRWFERDELTEYFTIYNINDITGVRKPQIYNEKGELQYYTQKITSVDKDYKTKRLMVKCQNTNGVDVYYINQDGKLERSHRA